jgi:hypothetical protein
LVTIDQFGETNVSLRGRIGGRVAAVAMKAVLRETNERFSKGTVKEGGRRSQR